jgi:hypothetical protein
VDLCKIEIGLISFAVITKKGHTHISQKSEIFDRGPCKSHRFEMIVTQMAIREACFVIQDETIPFFLVIANVPNHIFYLR